MERTKCSITKRARRSGNKSMRGIVVTYWVSKFSPSATQTEQPAMKINEPKTKEGREPRQVIFFDCGVSVSTFMSGSFLEMKRDASAGIPNVA
jgi:hypothetical protein